MELIDLNKKKFYTIKGTGRAFFYKITEIDKPSKKVYLKGVNTEDYGYCEWDKLRVFSDKFAADYIKWAKSIIKEIEKNYTNLILK